MMWVEEGGVVGYNPEYFKRANAPPSSRPVGMASSVLAQEYAFHLALSAMDMAMAVQKGERGNNNKLTLWKIPPFFSLNIGLNVHWGIMDLKPKVQTNNFYKD